MQNMLNPYNGQSRSILKGFEILLILIQIFSSSMNLMLSIYHSFIQYQSFNKICLDCLSKKPDVAVKRISIFLFCKKMMYVLLLLFKFLLNDPADAVQQMSIFLHFSVLDVVYVSMI